MSKKYVLIFTILSCLCHGNTVSESKVLKIYILAGQSNMEGQGAIASLDTPGTLEYTVANDPDKAYQFLLDADRKWLVRDDVSIRYISKHGKLAPGYGGAHYAPPLLIGPELGFGHYLGERMENKVLLIKVAWGGSTLAADYRPPSAEGNTGHLYKEVLRLVKETLSDLKTYVPDYQGQGYEIAGFVWHQGWSDRIKPKFTAEYANNMANLIRDMRKDLAVPTLPFVIATTGMDGEKRYTDLERAQLSLEDSKVFPEFEGKVSVIDTRVGGYKGMDFWYDSAVSPSSDSTHWNRNTKSYLNLGMAMADAMLLLTAEKVRTKPAFFDLSQLPTSGQSRQAKLQGVFEKGEKHKYSDRHDDNKLWIFRPQDLQAGEQRPCVFLIHGGSWSGHPMDYGAYAAQLVSKGYVVVIIEWRRYDVKQGFSPKDCLADCLTAYRWVKKRAKSFNISADEMFIVGNSAGGHLGLSMLTMEGHDDPQDDQSIKIDPKGLILINPAIDLVDGWHDGQRRCRAFNMNPAEFSPAHQVKAGLPPTLVISGSEDGVITPQQILAFKKRMEAKGNQCEFSEYADANHGAFHWAQTQVGNKYFFPAMADIERFITSVSGGKSALALEIKPAIEKGLTYAKTRYDSSYGPIETRWKVADGFVILDVTIPAKTTATVHIPTKSHFNVFEGKKRAYQVEGVKFLRMEEGHALFEIGSGSYHFKSVDQAFDLSQSPKNWLESQPIINEMLSAGEMHAYRSKHPDNKLWVFRPEGLKKDELRPCVFYIHGGSWSGNASMFAPQSIYLARRGVVGVSIEFRRYNKGQNISPEDCLSDCLSAYRWIKKNAHSLNIDPDRIVISGGSAGAHLGLSMLTLKGYDNPEDDQTIPIDPKGLILINPAIDLVDGWQHGQSRCWAFDMDPKNFSPAHHVRTYLPRTLVISGSNDNVITPKQIRAFQKRMKGKGNQCEFIEYPNVGHGVFNYGFSGIGSEYFFKAMKNVEEFLVPLAKASEVTFIRDKPAVNNGLNFVQIKNDSNSGISSKKSYTHAMDFGQGSVSTVNGVVFSRDFNLVAGGRSNSGSRTFGKEMHPGSHPPAVSGHVANLFHDFNFASLQGTIELSGLVSGKKYELCLYNRAWDYARTSRTFLISYDVGGDGSVEFTSPLIDQNNIAAVSKELSGNISWAMSYVYTADKQGKIRMTIDSKNSGSTYHLYALTNEEL
ncbi:alpha/beta hydrolase fold domain-containing protein [Lentisphaera profundi]|uniref:Alpha/beta hydrolase fold domain-containing protein n=1 Tax=Lentisphaera profundi TaxID=1658616 RepID=A0ABY7W2R0_9BACT|nr:alpha/beta hydrolase fold domain-containing protein [Lentisphaera profundi]WDE99402.1 alpha/beta hydrolase fold domain-containing protein [Lentisphaera profundi]